MHGGKSLLEVFDDAKKIHKLLGLTLTSRGTHLGEPIPMAGIPHHSLPVHVENLQVMGEKICIAEQIGDPDTSKGPVERKIVRFF